MRQRQSRGSSVSRSGPARQRVLAAGFALSIALLYPVGTQGQAQAQDRQIYIQWFETSWKNIESRLPDAFMSGYNASWLPPVWKASSGSPGYDVFDRFDIGQPGSETIYGTEQSFRVLVDEMRRARVESYVDLILNHNGGRTSNSTFLNDGGWPGFYLPASGPDFWGDFNNGLTQSTNPSDPNYNLFTGDLVGLIDIAQEKNYLFVRQPVASPPLPGQTNIPLGLVRNRPNPANARFYPDLQLTPTTFINPSNGASWTIYPFNTANPLAGDATMENAKQLLLRSVQWMLEDVKVDGFRLDAAKHIPASFWNDDFDAAIFNRRIYPNGNAGTPFTFGEVVDSNGFIQTYIRNKDGFGNRDALDLNQAGQLRDIRAGRGFGTWSNVLNSALDLQDDGFQNGSQGVRHVYSHDNGSTGSGGSAPGFPGLELAALPENALILFMSGKPIIYYNSREMHSRFANRGFWPREGNPTALGDGDPHLQRLVQIANQYVRNDNANLPGAPKNLFYTLNSTDPQNTSLNDVIVFERSNFLASDPTKNDIGVEAAASVLVGISDSYTPGVAFRSVQTSFPAGTRLRELTGAWNDPIVDASNQIPSVITVDGNRRVLLPVPNNAATVNGNTVEHHRGYVVYGPAAPSGTLTLTGATGVIPADPVSVPSFRRRTTPIDVITTPTFEIRLDTFKTDASDTNNWDDQAVFRLNGGFADYNGNGAFDQAANLQIDGGYEAFLTQRSPISGPTGTGTLGLYRQVIQTTQLPEGMNYLNVVCYRRRVDGGLPIFNDFRKVFYVDRLPPQVTLQPDVVAAGGGSFQYRVTTTDRTVTSVYVLANVPQGTNPLTLISGINQAFQHDRLEWRLTSSSLPGGVNQITVVAFELNGRSSVQTVALTFALGSGDVNRDGQVTIEDLYAAWALPFATYQLEVDINRNGTYELADRQALETLIRTQEIIKMRSTQR